MKAFIILLMLSSSAFAQCIPEPAKLTFGEKVSDDWVKRCEKQFRNPLPTCHRLYNRPSDRELCLGVITKLDIYDRAKNKPLEDQIAAEKAKAKK